MPQSGPGPLRLIVGAGLAAIVVGGAIAAWLLLRPPAPGENGMGAAAVPAREQDAAPAASAADARAALGRLGELGPVPGPLLAMASYRIGYALLSSPDPAEGIALIRDAAEQGFALAATTIGDGYQHGTFGLSKDHEEAMKWYGRALAAGNPVAAFEVATLHYNGTDVPEDPRRAAPLFRQAYFNNYPTAVDLVAKARAGDASAAGILARMGLDPAALGGTIGDIYREREATGAAATRGRLAQLVAEQQPLALYFLARMLAAGDGGERQPADAAKLFLESAQAGWWAANVHYARLALDGATGGPAPLAAALALELASAFPFRFENPALEPGRLLADARAKLDSRRAAALDGVTALFGSAPLPTAPEPAEP